MEQPKDNLVLVQDASTSIPRNISTRRIRIVLPAYNEENSLAPLLQGIEQAMGFHQFDYEILLVDDGSQDRTLKVSRDNSQRIPLRILQHVKNAGLGATIRDGLFDAVQRADEHDVIVTMDADNSHTPGLILRMVRAVDEGCDVVIASRYADGAQIHGVSLFRKILSLGASWLFRLVLPIPGVKDYTCGYRAYRADILRSAFTRYRQTFVEQDGFQCMVDILLKLRPMNLVFGEVPLILRYDRKRSQSKMKIGSTILGSLKLLARRRIEAWKEKLIPRST